MDPQYLSSVTDAPVKNEMSEAKLDLGTSLEHKVKEEKIKTPTLEPTEDQAFRLLFGTPAEGLEVMEEMDEAETKLRAGMNEDNTETEDPEPYDGDEVVNPDGSVSYEPINISLYPDSCRCLMRECLCRQKAWFVGQCMLCEKAISTDYKAYRMPRIKGGWTDCFCSWACTRKAIRSTGGNTMGREGCLDMAIQGESKYFEELADSEEDEDPMSDEDEDTMSDD